MLHNIRKLSRNFYRVIRGPESTTMTSSTTSLMLAIHFGSDFSSFFVMIAAEIFNPLSSIQLYEMRDTGCEKGSGAC